MIANHKVILYTLKPMDPSLQSILETITGKKQRLDTYRPMPQALVANLDEWFRVELTYASNAIEGNTLSRSETALVVEKGITIRGKSLREHLEAVNHAEALDYLSVLAGRAGRPITRHDLLSLHTLILRRIDDENAGRFRTISVRIAGSDVALPPPLQVPGLMDDFIAWLNEPHPEHPATFAADAHLRFVTIHPFVDGNGRLGRLLMNLLLMRGGYPPALIRKEDREEYISSLEAVQLSDETAGYYMIVFRSVERSLDIYLEAVEPKTKAESLPGDPGAPSPLLKIGELARQAGEPVPTIRYWTKEGLLSVASHTKSGYQLYHPKMVERVRLIRHMQKQERLTIAEIRDALAGAASAPVLHAQKEPS
jgi:Fic family protein